MILMKNMILSIVKKIDQRIVYLFMFCAAKENKYINMQIRVVLLLTCRSLFFITNLNYTTTTLQILYCV